ncbi:MAG: cation-translocating P-type ATPase [Spirochaetales bacterium]|nr:cation-translocating P-type ATPase [Spirochaetales bacterium]
MVEEAQDKKARTQRVLEKFSRSYTPAIVLLSLILYLVGHDVVLALTLLVIACPGAVVISAPISLVAGIGNGAKKGVLVKGGDVLEKLGKIKAIAFDKAGTLTKGSPQVVAVKDYGLGTTDLLHLAAVGESYSEHPLAKAILQFAAENIGEISEKPAESHFIAGQGLRFSLAEETFLIGNRRLFTDNGIDLTMQEDYLAAEEDKAHTAILVGDQRQVLGIISISDVARDEAKEIGLDGYFAEQLPEQKVISLQDLKRKYGRTAMVGDSDRWCGIRVCHGNRRCRARFV